MFVSPSSNQDLISVFPNLESPILNQVISDAWRQVKLNLQSFANLPEAELLQKLHLAFGHSFDEETALNIIYNWRNDNWEDIPSVEFLASTEFNGAFSRDTGKIYLSKEFVTGVVSQFNSVEEITLENEFLQELVAVSIEEIGHSLEAKLNEVEIGGDEGAIFSALVMGESLSKTELQKLKGEQDTTTVLVQQNSIQIEQSLANNQQQGTIFYHPTLSSEEINTLAKFAVAVYDDNVQVNGWENITPILTPNSLAKNGNTYFKDPFLLGLDSIFGDGSAVVAKKENTLILSFRGTDGIEDAIADVVPGGFPLHYSLFEELFEAFNNYVQQNQSIEKIWVTGHSLGAAMADKFMAENPGQKYSSVSFASPLASNDDNDQRVLNIGNENDLIYSVIGLRDSNKNSTMGIHTALEYFRDDNPSSGTHSMELYQYLTERILNSTYYDQMNRDSLVIIDRTDDGDDIEDKIPTFGDPNAFILGEDNRDDTLIGGRGDDVIEALGGNDYLIGDDGIFDGSDTLDGGNGNDTLEGDDDNDRLIGGSGNDFLDGGDGQDIAVFFDNYTNYQISKSQKNVGQIFVTHLDGEQDNLIEIESLEFGDQNILLSKLYGKDDISILDSFFQSLKQLFGGNSNSNNSVNIQSLNSEVSSLSNTNYSNPFDTKLPILGDVLGSLSNTASIFTEIEGALANLFQPDLLLTAQEIANELNKIDDNIDNLNFNVTVISESENGVEFALDLDGTVKLGSIDIASDLGLLEDFGFNLDASAEVDLIYNLDGLKFGVNQDQAYIKKDESDLEITVDVSLPSGGIDAQIGCIPIDLNLSDAFPSSLQFDFGVDLGSFNYNLDFSQLTDISLFNFDFDLPDVGGINLPGISGDIKLNLDELGNLDFSDSNNSNYEIPFSFDDITIDLGSLYRDFLKPALGPINQVLEPIKPIIEILNSEIPLVSQLTAQLGDISFLDLNNDGQLTFLDLAIFEATRQNIDVDFGLIETILEFGDLIVNLPDTGDVINLGDININNLGNIDTAPENFEPPNNLELPTGFNFHLLENPFDFVYNLIFGTTTEIFTYRTPKLDFLISSGVFIPVLGPIGFQFSGNFGAELQLGFGFDTSGLTCDNIDHSLDHPISILDGFYVSDTVNLDGTGEDIAEGKIIMGVGLNGGADIHLAKAFVGGRIEGEIEFDLNDEDQDGKILFSEIIDTLSNNPSDIFDPIDLTKLYAQLSSSFEVGFPGLSYRKEVPFTPDISLLEIGEQVQNKVNDIKNQIDKFIDAINSFDLGEILSDLGETVVRELENLGEAIGEGLSDLADLGAKVIDNIGDMVGDTVDNISNKLANFENNLREALEKVPVIGDIVNNPVVKRLGRALTNVREGVNDFLSDPGGFFTGGDKRIRYLSVDPKFTFDAVQVGRELWISWDSNDSSKFLSGNNGADLVVSVQEGKIVVDAPDFTVYEHIAIREKEKVSWGLGGRKESWEHDGDIKENLEYSNLRVFDINSVDSIVITGSNINDKILVDANTIDIPVVIAGREGDDLLQGGSGKNTIHGDAGDDTIIGGNRNDLLYGYTGNDVISGGNGNDRLDGYIGNDTISGGGGRDTIYGGENNDQLDGGNDNDTIYGHSGDDTIAGSGGNDNLSGGEGRDSLSGGEGRDDLFGGENQDSLFGGSDNDYLQGDNHNDYLEGGQGNDTLLGNEGDDDLFGDNQTGNVSGEDYLYGGKGDDYLIGGKDDDSLLGQEGADYLDGGTGDDYLIGGEDDNSDANDILKGGGGNDRLYGGYSGADKGVFRNKTEFDPNDILLGEDGIDLLLGQSGPDYLDGGTGDDHHDSLFTLPLYAGLYGGYGDDTIESGTGRDYISGGFGEDLLVSGYNPTTNLASDVDGSYDTDIIVATEFNDNIYAGDGDEDIFGLAGNDTIYGGWGNDSLYGQQGEDNLSGGAGNDYLVGGDKLDSLDGSDNLDGGSGDDTLEGAAKNDTLVGGVGNDSLDGGIGDDTLIGGIGDDTLIGGGGTNVLIGGFGNDTYVINASSDGGTIINNYDPQDGNETLEIEGLLLTKDHLFRDLDNQIADLSHQDLIIDISNDGAFKVDDDLVITNFFLRHSYDMRTPYHLIEDVGGISGNEILVDLNDSPDLLNITYTLLPIRKNPVEVAGQTIASILPDGSITDFDGVEEAIAIVKVDDKKENGEKKGTWQYSTDDGVNWITIDNKNIDETDNENIDETDNENIDETQALLLESDHKLRFVPVKDWTGTATFEFHAWDKARNTNNIREDLNAHQEHSTFSSNPPATGSILVTEPPPHFTWSQQIEAEVPPGEDRLTTGTSPMSIIARTNLRGIVVDKNNNIYVAGGTDGVIKDVYQGGTIDSWVAKLDEHGQLLWKDQPATSEEDLVFDLASDSNGHLLVLSHSQKDLNNPNQGSSRIFSYDVDGNRTLLAQINRETTNAEKLEVWTRLANDNNQHFYVLGLGIDETLRDEQLRTKISTDDPKSFNPDFMSLTKYTTTGSEQWQKLIPISVKDPSNSVGFYYRSHVFIETDKTDNLVAVFKTEEYQVNADGSWAFENLITEGLSVNTYHSQNGDLIDQWFIEVEEGQFESRVAAAIDLEGNLYLATDNYLVKYGSDQQKKWETSFNDFFRGTIVSITTDDNGDIYLSGDLGVTNPNDSMTWTIKYDSKGSVLWTKQFTPYTSWNGQPNYPNENYEGLSIRGAGVVVAPNQKIYSTGVILGEEYDNNLNLESVDTWVNKLVPFNNAPKLDASFSPVLTATLTGNPSQGNNVADIIVDESISEPDAQLVEAMAVIGVDEENGIWQYSLDDGNTWLNFNNPSDAQALLLAPEDRIRFIPNQDYIGEATFTFRAWDMGEFTDEFQVHSYTGSDQYNPSVAAQFNGGFVAVWQSYNPGPGGIGIYGQRYDYSGSRLGEQFQISPRLNEDLFTHRLPKITVLPNDDYIVVWESDPSMSGLSSIYGQRYNKEGDTQGTSFKISNSQNEGNDPVIALLPNGHFVVVWESLNQDSSQWGIYGQIFDHSNNKVGNEFQVNQETLNNQDTAAITTLSNGTFVVAWLSYHQSSANGLYAQIFASDGTNIGAEFLIKSNIRTYSSTNYSHSITGLKNDNFLVTWVSELDNSIYGQKFDSNGSKVNSEFLITTNGLNPSTTALSDDSFVVTWQYDGDDSSQYGVYGKRYDANGNPIDSQFKINSYHSSFNRNGEVITLANGNFLSVFEPYGQDGFGTGIYAKRFNPSGVIVPINEIQTGISDVSDVATITVHDRAYDSSFTTDEDNSIDGNFLTTENLTYFQLAIKQENNNNYFNLTEDTTLTLDSGATLRVNQYGDFSYNPNGKFESLAEGDETTDSFSYLIDYGDVSTEGTVTINIDGINDAPILNPNLNIEDLTTNEGELFSYTFPQNAFIDIDGDNLTYTAQLTNSSPLPDWLSFNPQNLSFSGTPTKDDIDNLEIQVIATDAEEIDASKVFSLKIEPLPRPDLLVSNLRIEENYIYPGQNITITFDVINQGNISTDSFVVDFYASSDQSISSDVDQYLGSYSWEDGINDNFILEYNSLSVTLPLANIPFWNQENKFYLGAIIDPDNEIDEAQEDNNYNQGLGFDIEEISLQNPGDLQVDSILLTGDYILPGQNVDISYNLKNTGLGNIPNLGFEVNLYISIDENITSEDLLLDSNSITEILESNQSIEYHKNLTLPELENEFWLAEGTDYYIGTIIDPTSIIFESDKNNNSNQELDRDYFSIPLLYEAPATSDTLPPSLVNLDFTPTVIDTSLGDTEIEVTIQFEDDFSGLDYAYIVFESQSGEKSINSVILSDSRLISGDKLDGIIQKNITLPQFSELGIWQLSQLDLIDEVGDRISFNTEQLKNADFATEFTVSGIEDSTAPELIDFNFTPTVINTSTADSEIEVNIEFSDDLSGLDYGYLVFESPSGEETISSVILSDYRLISGDSLNGVISRNITLPQESEIGTWQLKTLNLIDFTDNRVSLNAQQLETLNFPTEFSISEDDSLTGTTSDDTLNGGPGNDTLFGDQGDDQLEGGLDNDRLGGGEGDDTLLGNQGNDNLFANRGDDLLEGGLGDDLLKGGLGNDTLFGDQGDDQLEGGLDDDRLGGGEGDDTLLGNQGNDNLFANRGDDLLEGGLDDDILKGGSGNDSLYGDEGNDQLEGGLDDDRLAGWEGDDTLLGDEGNDQLLGHQGDDLLEGGLGDDLLKGGAGQDKFIFNSPTEGIDTIIGFSVGTDSIHASSSGFGGGLAVGTLLANQFVLGTQATTTNHRFIYNNTNGDFLFDIDGNGGTAATQIATLDTGLAMIHQDIIIFV